MAVLPAGTQNSDAELSGKVALVTGASRNIGRSIALALAAAGATVAINARSARADADKVAEEIRSVGGKAEVFMADIADAAAVKAMISGVLKAFGKIDILVLNAAVRNEKPYLEMSYDDWHGSLAITLDGAFFCTQACLPGMIAAGWGSIVTVGGMTSYSGAKNRVHGSAGKMGLIGMTRALAREFGDRGIRANCVLPGQMSAVRAVERPSRVSDTRAIPVGRKGEPGEIAATVRFLCSPGAGFITGQTISITGGQLMI
jgi:3-oxoacyl-[acyl-carrier protein] reductase